MVIVEFPGSIVVSSAVGNLCIVPTAVPIGTYDGGSTKEREVKGMKKDMDKIQFEYRYEVQELMKVIDKYVKQNPAEKENKTLERFFDLLDVMDMEW